MKRTFFIFLVLVLALGTAGFIQSNQAAGQPVDVRVTMKEYKLRLSRAHLPAGVPIRFIFEDTGTVIHEAVLEKAGEVDVPLELEGEEAEVEDIQPGQTVSAVWTISEPGQYQLACHIPGHFEGGMVSTFTIHSGGALVSLLFEYALYIAAAILALLAVILGLVFYNRRRQARAMAMP